MLDKIKNFPFVRAAYRLPGLVWLYHFFWAWFGAAIRGFPGKKIFVIGMTGTKGKTTTIELLNAILEAAGKKTALISSLRVKIGSESEKNRLGNSMPGRGYLQKFLSKAVEAECQYAIIEVTSQGTVLSRHRFLNWNIGILTNLAPEHIESHGGFEKYREAKFKFLRYAAERGAKIFLNADDGSADFFGNNLSKFSPVLYSKSDESVSAVIPGPHPLSAALGGEAENFVWSDFNKENAAAAVFAARYLGISEKNIDGALRHFRAVSGRMEFVRRRPFSVVVDYAHTPDSLLAAYRYLKPTSRRLICVFGAAGGGRDKWKRAEMGKVAAEYCDEIVLTNEDPYDENPGLILSEIKSGIYDFPARAKASAGGKFPISNLHEIIDRKEAIKKAIGLAREGDTVVLTGKGSEDWIHVEDGKKIPWDEKKVAEDLLRQK